MSDEDNVFQFRPRPRPRTEEIILEEEWVEWFGIHDTILITDYIREDCRELDNFELICLVAPEVVLSLALELVET